MIVRIFAGSLIALGLGLYTEGASAAETFVCDDGRLLQLEPYQIKRMKHFDACVAAHYGIQIAAVPLPVQRPDAKPPVQLKGTRSAKAERAQNREIAKANVDFRNVRIINAAPGSTAWYRQTR